MLVEAEQFVMEAKFAAVMGMDVAVVDTMAAACFLCDAVCVYTLVLFLDLDPLDQSHLHLLMMKDESDELLKTGNGVELESQLVEVSL